MNTMNKQLIFNKILTFIREQGVGSPKFYCNKTGKMCSLGFLWSDIKEDGKNRLKRIFNSLYYHDREEELMKDITGHFSDVEHSFFIELSNIHDSSSYQETYGGPKAIVTFEVKMKELASKNNLEYTDNCVVIDFPIIAANPLGKLEAA